MRRACVLGWPVSHSLSPRLHGYWLNAYGIDGDYTAMAVMPEQLKDTLALLQGKGYAGCNLTMPLKEQALSLMDAHDESCLVAGAVNTVVFDDGKTRGFNSDGFGFIESLKAQIPNWNGARVVILGAGGAARGIVVALRTAGAKSFVLVNRTREKAQQVARQLAPEAEIINWAHRAQALDNATLLVNCTSLGMMGMPPLEIDLSALPPEAAVADIVYRPLRTPLLHAAKKRGHSVAEGLPMLLHQGRLGFQHWFGRDPEVTQGLYDAMAAAALAA